MLFTLEALKAKHGDCLLLHYGPADAPKRVLVDGGPPGAFNRFLRPRLEELAGEKSLPVELLMMSHIDDDHIAGILDLTRTLRRQRERNEVELVSIRRLWHNSFDDVVGREPERLERAAREGISAASTADEVPREVLAAHPGALVLASVNQGRRLRNDASLLGLSVNLGDGLPLTAAADVQPLGDTLELRVLGPLAAQIEAFQAEWDRQIEKLGVAEAGVEAAAYLDGSVFNLASLVVLAEAEGKRMLLTGDARGDHVLQGLEQAGLWRPDERFHVDLLKLPHHGSDRNVETDFFRAVTADHYVVSGDGRHGNPELATFQMIFDARDDGEPFTLHLTYAPEDLREEGNGEALAALFAAEREAGRRFEVASAEGPSLSIDLLEPLGG